ncbi:MAG: DUF58 domain-containing protein [Lewinellaceae bacterium]|nr:DUF58 domain-containing protein [Saprospiraceae bacterium]MCB9344999.1 DUF58 domain-containing protein [Lewinellaceae bacterium]
MFEIFRITLFLTNRFFWLNGILVALFALAFPFSWLFPIAKTAFVILYALALGDAALLYLNKPKINCRRELASVFSLSDPNPVQIFIENQGNIFFDAKVIDELPVQFQNRDFEFSMSLSPGEEKHYEHHLRPLSRGEYLFGKLNVFLSTRLGLLERRLKFDLAQNVAVYPSIIQMKQFELRAMQHIAHETGIKKMRRIGHSYEFEQIKNYVPGDDYRSINWKASSRRGSLMVNQYEDERSQQVYCVVDKSRAMKMPFEGLSLMDYSINAVLAISNIILKKQDKAGLLTFSDVIGATIKAERDTSHLNRIMEALYREKERPGESNYELLYEAVRRLVGARSLLLLFTNFESSYALERSLPTLRRLNRQHLLVVIFFENTEIRKLANEDVKTTADIYRQTIARQFLQEKKEMVNKLQQYGIQAVLTKPQDLTLNTINKYLELKSRGLI